MSNKEESLIINGWHIFAHDVFLQQLNEIIFQVDMLRQKNSANYPTKNASKRLAAILKLILEKIPKDPTLPEYRQGITLGEKYKHWFRAKFFQQYRLFFRYHFETKIIIYAWVNDVNSKRAYDSNSDAYLVFKKMLKKRRPPDDWNELLVEAQKNNGLKFLINDE